MRRDEPSLMECYVQIDRFVGDRALVLEIIAAAGYAVTTVSEDPEGGWRLTHAKYSSAANVGDIHSDATELAETLAHIARLENLELGMDIGPVIYRLTDGTEKKHHYVAVNDCALVLDTFSATVTVSSQLSQDEQERRAKEAARKAAEEKRRALIARMGAAVKNPTIVHVMELLQISNPDPTELGHIVDIVKDACSGDLGKFCSARDQRRFYHSINHPSIMGLKARHAVTNNEPPSNPMDLDDAKAFASGIARAWIRQHESDS